MGVGFLGSYGVAEFVPVTRISPYAPMPLSPYAPLPDCGPRSGQIEAGFLVGLHPARRQRHRLLLRQPAVGDLGFQRVSQTPAGLRGVCRRNARPERISAE